MKATFDIILIIGTGAIIVYISVFKFLIYMQLRSSLLLECWIWGENGASDDDDDKKNNTFAGTGAKLEKCVKC